jgi:hypothetical protein
MPGGDGTGPIGMGPRTGRGMGLCAGSSTPGSMSPVGGRGFWGHGRGAGYPTPGYMSPVGGRGFWGRGRGGGRGRRHWFYATGLPFWARFGGYAAPQQPKKELERQALQGRAEALQSELDSIKKRMTEMEAASEVK